MNKQAVKQSADREAMNYDYIITEGKHHHASMVSAITEIMAKKKGLPPEQVELAKKAAMLHDIGKNFIPTEILNKPGRLTTEEYSVIKTHADLGFEYLINQIQVLFLGAILALQHHERVDGGGYQNMPTEAIHPLSKLIAVADVFDALCSQRPYKAPWPSQKIKQTLTSSKGTQFEPECVDLILSCLDDILVLYKKGKRNSEDDYD